MSQSSPSSLSMTSLHHLLSGKKWKDAESILDSNPSLAFEIGSPFNVLPLVTALMNQCPLWLLDSLIDANPAAVNSKNEFGMLPIRVAIRSNCGTAVVKALIRENPENVKCFGVSGKTCLHLACLYNADLELIEKLIEIWPEATEWRDRDGWHPLHLACLCGSSTDITKRIIDCYSNAAAMPDTPEHQLPFHIAVSQNAPFETLRILLDAYPDAVKTHTKTKGFLPLHMACCHRNSDPLIVKFLLEKYPDGAMAHTKESKSLPLHLAARYGAGMDVIQLLTTAYPQGLGEKNSFGETPFTSTYTNEPAPALRVSAWDTNAQASSDSKAADSPLHRFSTPTGTYSGIHKS